MKTNFITLLLATVIFICCSPSKNEVTVEVDNPSTIDRDHEMVELSWEPLQEKLLLSEGQTIIVVGKNGQQIPYQLVTQGSGVPRKLIFPVSLKAGETASFKITTGKPDSFTPLVYGRLVPERKDDFAWENNRSAFRVYGPALKATGEISNGMDFWAKKTESLIIDKWYKDDLAGVASYHTDHGEGLDFYKVGRTLGLGMTAPVDHDTLCLGDNFVTAQVLDNGPLRISFALSYDPYQVGDKKVTETRIINLDAYSYFNKVIQTFQTDADKLTLATGIVMPEDNTVFSDLSGIIAYETPTDKTNGTVYTAAIHPDGFENVEVKNGHILGFNSFNPNSTYLTYAGGGWSKAGFGSFDEWIQFVKNEKEKINQRLVVKII